MNLFEYTPQKNIKRLSILTGTLFIGAAVLMLTTLLIEGMPYRWVIQLISLCMLSAGIFITTRYAMKSYVYAVVSAEDGNDLTVTEIQNRHTITVCRIALSSIEETVTVSVGDNGANDMIKRRIRAEKRKHFNYCADLFPEKYICLFVNECGDSLTIKLSWDGALEDILKNAAIRFDKA